MLDCCASGPDLNVDISPKENKNNTAVSPSRVRRVLIIRGLGTMRFFIVQTDAEGRFRRNGLGPDVDPEKVEFSCEKDGFRTVEVMHRKMSSAKLSPIEIECLLARN